MIEDLHISVPLNEVPEAQVGNYFTLSQMLGEFLIIQKPDNTFYFLCSRECDIVRICESFDWYIVSKDAFNDRLCIGIGLADKADTYPNMLSGGQKQRLTIARALLRKPKVLILDDSTSAVDTATDAKIRKAFREEIPGTTKIIIAQRISSVQDADRILVLDNGQINGLGTHEELLKTNKIYQEVYNSQTQGGGDFDKQGGEQ